jgi:ribosome biogenesis GTPase A
MTRASSLKMCVVAAQPGHTKGLQSVRLERGLRIVNSLGVVFEDDDSIQGQKALYPSSFMIYHN